MVLIYTVPEVYLNIKHVNINISFVVSNAAATTMYKERGIEVSGKLLLSRFAVYSCLKFSSISLV